MNHNRIFRILSFLFVSCGVLSPLSRAQEEIPVPDSLWRLWPDRAASWENDSLYLPDDVDLARLPVNMPTGGWEVLDTVRSLTVTLPSTVEEHLWGAGGFRPYANGEYVYESEDSTVRNGSYTGVSWWVRDIDLPRGMKGKNVTLFIRGARLRAEVYWNRQLVGYHLIGETSFTCDVSSAIRSGMKNRLAVRITNPGGRLDWVDTELMKWGSRSFHKSHGFGGLDRGIRLTVHEPVFLREIHVLNTPRLDSVTAFCTAVNLEKKPVDAAVTFDVVDPASGDKPCGRSTVSVRLPAGGALPVSAGLTAPGAKPWSPGDPRLYRLRATIVPRGVKRKDADRAVLPFGFRWFEASGVGENAVLRLNGLRIRLLSAISWGFWGVNGLWPTPALAEREVRAAKSFGMNCLQFHRNVGKTEVLDAQDRLGLLRYMEPGGGQTALGEKFGLYAPSPASPPDVSGSGGDAQTFAERYMEEKIVRMVRDERSHPSLVMYSLQNEIHPDLRNPRIFRILRRVHREDPSRIVVLKSGFPENNPVNEAWMKPYDDSVYCDRGNAYSGWWDAHTVGGPGVWKDDMYLSPSDFTHRSTNKKEIVVWGEMLGSASPDNHAAMVREIDARGGKSYDAADHREILAAYERFLDRWNFRGAFPSAESLFTSVGNRAYDFWGRVVETARLCEENDFLVMSGWESTAIENHSGLVDNLRGFKGDPRLLGMRAAPLRPVIKTGSTVLARGSGTIAGVFLVNEAHVPHGARMNVTLSGPSGVKTALGTYPVPPYSEGRFVYPVAQSIPLGPFALAGEHSIRADVIGGAGGTWTEKVLVVDTVSPGGIPGKSVRNIGMISVFPPLSKPFDPLPGVHVEPYRSGAKYDLIIAANRFVTPPSASVEPERVIRGTDDPELYRSIHYGSPENFDYSFSGLRDGRVRVTLKFAEIVRDQPGIRVFDVALNGKTVLKDFDVFSAAGGKNIAFDTSFTVSDPGGLLRITVPRVGAGSARICAIRVDDGDTVLAVRCGGKPYRDTKGVLWGPYEPSVRLDGEAAGAVRAGTPLLVLAEGEGATTSYAATLERLGALKYSGYLGEARASWMGSWYFVRDHPVFEGLPVDCAMGSTYQVGVENSGGVMVDGPGVDVFVGYSRDHDRNIAAGSFTASLGKGKVLFHCIPGVVSGLNAQGATGMHPVLLKRLIANSLEYLARP
jgi:beta-galactosidase